jgi:hypothetical protein
LAKLGANLPEGSLPLGGQMECFDDQWCRGRINFDSPPIVNDHVAITERRDAWALSSLHAGGHGLLGDLGPDLVEAVGQIVTC